MVQSEKPPANAFVAQARKIYNPIGFSKGYNFVLWFIFLGALFGFTLARLQYLNIFGVYCGESAAASSGALPGECFYYLQPRSREQIGIILHLGCILPASLLVCLQFIPVLRHKAIIVHRINGYIVVLLSLIGTAGALMIARHSFGGGIEIQTGVGVLGIMFIGSLVLAFINIKRLQIEQHRAWMLRAWFYAGAIITLRIIMILTVMIMDVTGEYYIAQPCDKINFILKSAEKTATRYPECAAFFSGENPSQQALVQAKYSGTDAVQVTAAFNLVFGMAAWLAVALHAIGVELYLRLTPAEAERLRNVSYQRQVEAGLKPAGRAGLTADRLGDAATWQPRDAYKAEKVSSGSDQQHLATPLS
ncbi:hypothetical protein JX265_000091 [Neoarthrinium moseri]|uniref:Microtubule associated protein n=1 Tax=Neoarthrinium moseri TaxID=1658444 RepID=A0A9Q0AWI2_9PEZI|nr:hypothetical protein JX266_008095 [Neoarthrinium moseri]KAI1881265.1 hypothetical protein JX265_000091 [Neoarthrinium moseri]